MQAVGKVVHIGETQQVSDRFRKREVVLEIADKPEYPQAVCFELHQDNTALADGIALGDEAKVLFDLRGRKWTAHDGKVKYFNTLVAWRFEVLDRAQGGQTAAQAETQQQAPPQPQTKQQDLIPEDDQIPF